MINFGAYDQKLEFYTVGQIADGYGGFTASFDFELETFAAVKQLSGSNDLEQAQLGLPKTYLFKVQKRSGFIPNQSMQILYQGQYYVIKGIEERSERLAKEWLITAIKSEQNLEIPT